MIRITKNEVPKKWQERQSTPEAVYESIPELVESLLQEQGYICAYCMRRIPCKDKLYDKDGITFVQTAENHRVEHILSRKNHPDRELDYQNMVICCPGHIGTDEHCDRLKGENDISFTPLDENFISTLSYKKDGEIVSSNTQYNKEINEVLNLNTPLLKANRKETWDKVVAQMTASQRGKPWSKAIISEYIKKYSSKNDKHQYYPYSGIVVYYLQKKLKRLA